MPAPLAFITKGGTCRFTFDERTVYASEGGPPPCAFISCTLHHSAIHNLLIIRSLTNLEPGLPPSRCPIITTTPDRANEEATILDRSTRPNPIGRQPLHPKKLRLISLSVEIIGPLKICGCLTLILATLRPLHFTVVQRRHGCHR